MTAREWVMRREGKHPDMVTFWLFFIQGVLLGVFALVWVVMVMACLVKVFRG